MNPNIIAVILYFLVTNADQATSESSIPLSPQWLYAKPVEAKILIGGTSGVWTYQAIFNLFILHWKKWWKIGWFIGT